MISKELFNEVMNLDNLDFEYPLEYYNTNNSIRFWVIENPKYQSTSNYINIYELAHKCKEWALKKGYVVGTDLNKVNVWSIKERIIINHFEVYFEDYLEFEIKACQWILENKN